MFVLKAYTTVHLEGENINKNTPFMVEEIAKQITDIIINCGNYCLIYRFSSSKQPYNRLIFTYCYQFFVGPSSSFHPGRTNCLRL